MPEMKNSFQKGRMNKDLDERIVPQGEYRDALNVEVNTSEGSDIGTLQTIMGNMQMSNQGWSGNGTCIGSIANDRTNKIYFMIAGENRDFIIEYDQENSSFAPVCVDAHWGSSNRALNFNRPTLITGINVIDDMLYWTDNASEPKRINITRGKHGSQAAGILNYSATTKVVVKDTTNPGALIDALDEMGGIIQISEKHLTVIKLGPPTAPVLEMVDTEKGDWDGDEAIGGNEVLRSMSSLGSDWLDVQGEFFTSYVVSVSTDLDGDGTGTDFSSGDYLEIYAVEDPSIKVRVLVQGGGPIGYTCQYMAGDKDIAMFDDFMVGLIQPSALFEFKLPRFGCRYKYTDGEYSAFSPFTEVAFLPGSYNYMSKEGYNLGMVNRLRKLAIKDFVHTRKLPEDVVSIDILYKESNSTNIYTVKTIKKRVYDPEKWDEWNAVSGTRVVPGPTPTPNNTGWINKTKGYLPITSEMIHAVLPANQLLRPWDNVPRKALAQEVVGNRLVYGNYLQNYNLGNIALDENNIKVDIKADIRSWELGSEAPEQIRAPRGGFMGNLKGYSTGKSLKTLRTYQLGVVYIDKYGRETPVFSEDKIGVSDTTTPTPFTGSSSASVYNDKKNAHLRNSLTSRLKSTPPDWATHFKFFVKETSNEYYNLAMDRWYDAEDGNIWLSFPSAERNKVDEETFIILKKEHDNNTAVTERARYKILAIENEAPRFIKLQYNTIGVLTDDGTVLGHAGAGYPLIGEVAISVTATDYNNAVLDVNLSEKGVTNCFMRMSTSTGVSRWYEIRSVSKDGAFYRILAKEEFKEDMGIMSADNTIGTFITTGTLTIVRREPVDKAEFDGRFFAKILKDVTLIDRLGVNLDAVVKLKTLVAQKVQYIDPMATQAGATGQFFGQDKYKLSVDEQMYWANSAETGGHGGSGSGDGREFWKHAGDDNDFNGSDSSGWFIDKVEGFRPWKGHAHTAPFSQHNRKNIDFRWDPYMPSGLAVGWPSGYENDMPPQMLNAHNINAYNITADNLSTMTGAAYLGMASMRTHNIMTSQTSSSTAIAYGQGVAKPFGIDKASSMINISYSGINDSGSNSSGNYSSTTLAGLDNHYFKETGSANQEQHVADVMFIQKLTAPGTLWRWKEDPGQVVYKTVPPTGLTATSSPMSQQQWDAEQSDVVDNEKGTLLFNYAVFSDYLINTHHYEQVNYWCLGNQSPNHNKAGWVSGDYGDAETFCFTCSWSYYPFPFSNTRFYDPVGCCLCVPWSYPWLWAIFPPEHHPSYPRARVHDGLATHGSHGSFPQGILEWNSQRNKRRRFAFQAETSDAQGQASGVGVGNYPPHYYSPTNDHSLTSHHDASAQPITTNPATGVDFDTLGVTGYAPGIRPDGMYTGYPDPDGSYTWQGPGGAITDDKIPQYKRWGTNDIQMDRVPGSVTWEILEPFVEDTDGSSQFSSTNPAIWETEPKEDVGLDIYHEIGQIYPIHLNNETIEQFVGAIGEDVTKNSYVQCWDPPYISVPSATATGLTIVLKTDTLGIPNDDMRVSAAYDRWVQLSSSDGVVLDGGLAGHTPPSLGAFLIFHRADGGATEAHVASIWNEVGVGDWYELSGNMTENEVGVHNKMITLPFFNCYSFGNGVESDRIRDDFNQVKIDNGPKVSTTIEGQYVEDRRENGFIWSGIYNSTSGVNNLNQFIQAEAITKDVNPSYGSIQKMSVRDSDLVAFCEDRVLKVLADKDALFNADGNTNLVATNRVLGNVKPFLGDYGISRNPESFAKDSYRSYFTDTSRGAVVRLSQDGLTPISDAGMKDWFGDNLSNYNNSFSTRIIGSFDDKKQEYNITLIPDWGKFHVMPPESTTLSYSEPSKGWVSFKSFLHENGISINNNYFTFRNSLIYQHHANAVRNNFYGSQFDSSVDTLFNQAPSTIKSFSTLNYEGSQSRITQDTITNPDYYDNIVKSGWYVQNLISNAQELGSMEFWDKEDKWFSQIKGVTTQWLNDGTAGNIDPREFSYQGIGNAFDVSCPNCPPVQTSYNCIPASGATSYQAAIPAVAAVPYQAEILYQAAIPYQAATAAVAAVPYQAEIPYQASTPFIPGTAGQPFIAYSPEVLFVAEVIAVTGSPYYPAYTMNGCLSIVGPWSGAAGGQPDNGNVMVITSSTGQSFDMPWHAPDGTPHMTNKVAGGLSQIVPWVTGTSYLGFGIKVEWPVGSGILYWTGCSGDGTSTVGPFGNGTINLREHVAGHIDDTNYGTCHTSNRSLINTAATGTFYGNTQNSDRSIPLDDPVDPTATWPYSPNVSDTPDIAVDIMGNKWWNLCPTQAMPATPAVAAVTGVAEVPYQAEIIGQPFIAFVADIMGTAEVLYQAEVLAVAAVAATSAQAAQAAIPYQPEILAVAAVPYQAEVLASAATPQQCVMISGLSGTYATAQLCDDNCHPQTWECASATSTSWPFLVTNYCNELFDGSGFYTSLSNCDTNCISPPIPESWECDSNNNCIELFDGTGAFPDEATCLATCGVAPGTWDCVTGVCVDPGTGFGQYSDLAVCQAACNPIMVGPCDVQGAPEWVGNPGDVNFLGDVVWMGYHPDLTPIWWHLIGTQPSTVNTGVFDMSFMFGNTCVSGTDNCWEPCLGAPAFVGSCNISLSTEWLSEVQDETIPMDDGTFGYDAGDVTSVTWWNGNITYFYAVDDIDPASTFYPSGTTYDDTVNLPWGEMNPWMDCDAVIDAGDCVVDDFQVWDPAFNYQTGLADNSPSNNHWAVWHDGMFWTLLSYVPDSITDYFDGNSGTFGYKWVLPNPWGYGDGANTGSTVLGADGTVNDHNLPNGVGEQIESDQMDLLSGTFDMTGIEPGTPYSAWLPCIPFTPGMDNYFGCCNASLADFGQSSYGSCADWQNCMGDGLCSCDPALCGNC